MGNKADDQAQRNAYLAELRARGGTLAAKQVDGLGLRDSLALRAIAILLEEGTKHGTFRHPWGWYAASAYAIADAMIASRGKGNDHVTVRD